MIRYLTDGFFILFSAQMMYAATVYAIPERVVQDPLALPQPTKLYFIDCMGVGPSIKMQEFKRFHLQ